MKAGLMIKDKARVLNQLQLRLMRMNQVPDETYRRIVREIFLRVLNQTPQYSGAAVAHWVIGLGAPAHLSSDALGDRDEKLMRSMTGERQPRQRGDRYWKRVAWEREKPKLDRLKWGVGVYLTNGVWGDTDNGQSIENYITALQDPVYAAQKLRAANQPYELVQDSVAYVAARWRHRKIPLFRSSLSLPDAVEDI